MPDIEYLKAVYENLNHAYGKEGVVSKGALSSSYDDFANKMQSDSSYAKGVYENLDYAYGKNGKVAKGVLSTDFDGFYQKIKPTPLPSAQQQMPNMGIQPVGTYQQSQPQPQKDLITQMKEQAKVEGGVPTIHDNHVAKSNKPDIKEAIDHAVIEHNKQFGVHGKPDMNFGREEITKKYKDGDLALDFDGEGKSVLKNTTSGLFDSFVNAVNKASIERADNANLSSLDTEGKIKYLEAKKVLDAQDDKVAGNKVLGFNLGNTVGKALNKTTDFGGENADMLTKTAAGAMTGGALAPELIGAGHFGGFINTVRDFATGGYGSALQKTYGELRQQGMPEKEAMERAHKAGLVGEATGIGAGAVLSGLPKFKPDEGVVHDFINTLIKSSGKMGGVSGGESFVNNIAEKSQGVHKSRQQILDEIGNGALQGVGTALAFETLLNIHKVPVAIYNQARKVVSSIPEGVRDEFINNAVLSGQLPKEKAEEIKTSITPVNIGGKEHDLKPYEEPNAPKVKGEPETVSKPVELEPIDTSKLLENKPVPNEQNEGLGNKETKQEGVVGNEPIEPKKEDSADTGVDKIVESAKEEKVNYTPVKSHKELNDGDLVVYESRADGGDTVYKVENKKGDTFDLINIKRPTNSIKKAEVGDKEFKGKYDANTKSSETKQAATDIPAVVDSSSPKPEVVNEEPTAQENNPTAEEKQFSQEAGTEAIGDSVPNPPTEQKSSIDDTSNRATASSPDKAVSTETPKSEVSGNEKPVPENVNEVGQGDAEPPTSFPAGDGGKSEHVGITHAATDKLAEELGLPDRYEKDPTTREKQDAEAVKRIANGDMPAVIKKLQNKEMPSDIEQRMMAHHLGELKSEYEKTKSDKTLLEIKKLKALSDEIGGREVAKSLQARQEAVHPLEGGEASAKVARMEALGVDKLTDKQKLEVEQMVNEYKAIAENEKAKREAVEKKYDDFIAEQEVAKIKAAEKAAAKKSSSNAPRKTREDFAKERTDIVNNISEKLRKSRGQANDIVTASVDFLKITPDVLKLAKSLVEEKLTIDLPELVAKVHDILKDPIPEITERDVRDIIAGKYNKKQETKNELKAKWEDIRQEQKLLDELASETAKKPKTEKEETARNQKLTDLRKAIGEKRMAEIEADKHQQKITELNEELERVRSRKAKEPIDKGKPKEVSAEEQEVLDKIEAEQEKWDAEKDNARQLAKDYQKIETERNRQLQRVSDLKAKLSILQDGRLPDATVKGEPKTDVPEIEALKQEIAETEKSVRESIAHEKKMKDLSDELQRLKERREKYAKPDNDKEYSADEKNLRDKIEAERKSWNNEKSRDNRIKSLEKELQDLKDRKAKTKTVKNGTSDPEIKKLEDAIKTERESWAHEKKMDVLETELQRIKDRKVKDPKSKRVIGGEEKAKRDEIEAEQKAWDIEKNVEKLKTELQRVRDRKAKVTKPQNKRELEDVEKEIIRQIKDENKAWAKEVEPERKLRQAIKNAEKSIADLEEQISNKAVDVKIKKTQPTSAELEARKKKLSELQTQYKKLKDDLGITDENKIKNIIRSNNATKLKYLQRIADGKFDSEPKVPFSENFEFKNKYPKLFEEAMTAIREKNDAKTAFDIALTNDKLAKENKLQKTYRFFGKVKNTLQSMVAGVDDSLMFVQLGYTLLNNPSVAVNFRKYTDANGKVKFALGGSIKEHVLDAISKKRFETQMTALHESAGWPLIKASGLDVLEPQSLLDKQKEEMFQHNLAEYVGTKKVNLGQFLAIWERAYTSLGNNTRVNLFLKQAKVLYEKGMTIENNLEEFKGLATAINNLTGRGSTNAKIAQVIPVITPVIWSPKMIASSLNLLGISDIATGGQAGFYSKLPPKARAYAARQMAEGFSIAGGLMLAAALGGHTVHYNPHDPRFGDIEFGEDGSKAINVFGRYGSMMRLVVQLWPAFLGGGRINSKGITEDVGEEGGKTRGQVAGGFLRGKMNPVSGLAFDYLLNDKKGYYDKKPLTLAQSAKDLTIPMSLRDVRKEMDRDGTISIFNYDLPSFVGMSMKDQRDYYSNQTNDKTIDSFLEKNKLKLTSTTSVTIPKDDKHPLGKPTDDEMDKFTKAKGKIVEDGIKQLMKTGWATGEEEVKPTNKLTPDELKGAIKYITDHATDKAKEEVFGKVEKDKEVEHDKRRNSKINQQILSGQY